MATLRITTYVEEYKSDNPPISDEPVERYAMRLCMALGMSVDEAATFVLEAMTS